jgi:hypothetical protein
MIARMMIAFVVSPRNADSTAVPMSRMSMGFLN